MGPKSNGWYPHKKGRFGQGDPDPERGQPHKDSGRNLITPTSQGNGFVGNHQKLGSIKEGFFPRAFREIMAHATP